MTFDFVGRDNFFVLFKAKRMKANFLSLSLTMALMSLIGCAVGSRNFKSSTLQKAVLDKPDSKTQQAPDIEAAMTQVQQCGLNPIVVGHRGAPGYVPEHTLRSYALALDMGADYIEPDLVSTKDGYLIARHENEISETTDVAEKYPKRKRTKIIENESKTGWFTEDFTLAEIKNLRARERLPFRSHTEDGIHEVPTFEEILGFVKLQEKKRRRSIGLAPEIKHSAYFSQIGLPMESKFVRLLKKYNLNEKNSPIMVQSFESDNLRRLRALTAVRLVQLLDDPPRWPYDLTAIREYAEWVSPPKKFIAPVDENGEIHSVTDFVRSAQTAGLKVMPYTFRSDDIYLAKTYNGDPTKEYWLFFNQGVDGIFSDFPDHAVAAKKQHRDQCASSVRGR